MLHVILPMCKSEHSNSKCSKPVSYSEKQSVDSQWGGFNVHSESIFEQSE